LVGYKSKIFRETKIALAMFLVIEENCNMYWKKGIFLPQPRNASYRREDNKSIAKILQLYVSWLISISQNVDLVRKLTIWKQHHNQETI
jgi:hypothetical protein